MQTFGAFLVSFVAAVSASPLFPRDSCNAVPAGSDASIKPISAPTVTTADLCHKACLANTSCKAFVFGLPPNADAPICELFSVPAAQIPFVQTNLNAFDSACDNIPTVAPDADHPQGTLPADDNNKTEQPSNEQSGDQKQGEQGQQQQKQQQHKRDDRCKVAPSGPAGSPTPLKTLTTPKNLDGCLALCKATAGCQSVEFGSPSPGAPEECILFSVPVSQLPPPATGASIVASDVGC